MRKLLSLIAFSLLLVRISYGQDVVVDWAAKKVTSQPSSVEKNTTATVQVNNVNDMMFTYSISFQLKPLQASDFDAIAKAFSIAGKAAAGEAVTCDISKVLASQKALADAEAEFLNMPATNQGCSKSKPCDVTLQQAQAAWKQSVQPKVDSAQTDLSDFTAACTSDSFQPAVKSATDAINQALNTINGPHSILKPNAIQMSPDAITSLEVDQLWMGVPTTNGTYSVDLQPSNNRLTLSAGALFSEVQNRSYTVSAVPNSAGTGTSNVLSVAGVSRFNPTGVALLNYEVPGLDWERVGFALSSGPVFRLGSKSDASSFGYFAGVSVHLFHRFYITPGFHLGQFADFPPGFSANRLVPSGIGTPTPVNRWTWRFGFAFSYKAKDFGQFGLSASVNQVPANNTNKGSGTTPDTGKSMQGQDKKTQTDSGKTQK